MDKYTKLLGIFLSVSLLLNGVFYINLTSLISDIDKLESVLDLLITNYNSLSDDCNNENPDFSSLEGSLGFIGEICGSIKRAANGEIEDLGCEYNMLVDQGKTFIRDDLLSTSLTDISVMGFGNGSAVASSSTTLASEITTCGFGARATGTKYIVNSTAFTIQRQVTSTCDNIIVNTTGLFNGTTGNMLVFGGTIPSAPTMQSSDQLTMNYTINVI